MSHTSIRTGSQDRKALAFILQTTGGRGYQSRPGSTKGVTNRQRPTLDVELVHSYFTDLFSSEGVVGELLRIHGSQVRQQLTSKGFVNLVHSNVCLEI